jgi:hypothetical protein
VGKDTMGWREFIAQGQVERMPYRMGRCKQSDAGLKMYPRHYYTGFKICTPNRSNHKNLFIYLFIHLFICLFIYYLFDMGKKE